MGTNIVKIKGTEFKVKNTIRAVFVFEQITGRGFEVRTSLDNFLFLYSVILANNPDKALTWEEFLNAMDEDKNLFEQMNEILNKASEVEQLLEPEEKEGGDSEKKN